LDAAHVVFGADAGPLLVTGAGGFLGRRLTNLLSEVTHLRLEHRWSDRGQLQALLGDTRPGRCIHLGWYANPRDYLTNVEENLRSLAASLALLDELTERQCTHLVVAGTCAEYGPSENPLRESDPISPWSIYGATKHAFATVAGNALDGPAMAWARVFNVTGPGEHEDRLVPTVLRRVRAGMPVDLTDGTQRRDYLDVDDVARAILALSDQGQVGTFNVCSGQGVALRDLLVALVGESPLLRFGVRPRGRRDPDSVVGVPDELIRATGWQPQYDLTAMLARAAAP
jgi:dTDP-6-deoxy-L-talose 4-dehydrogenase (NAD+)